MEHRAPIASPTALSTNRATTDDVPQPAGACQAPLLCGFIVCMLAGTCSCRRQCPDAPRFAKVSCSLLTNLMRSASMVAVQAYSRIVKCRFCCWSLEIRSDGRRERKWSFALESTRERSRFFVWPHLHRRLSPLSFAERRRNLFPLDSISNSSCRYGSGKACCSFHLSWRAALVRGRSGHVTCSCRAQCAGKRVQTRDANPRVGALFS